LEFDGDMQWGYGTSLFFCLQTSAGGANQLKHFVRACHQRGIAVIMDIVYNHFSDPGNNRSEWGYDVDPKEVLRESTNALYFAEILDVFVSAGWPDATQIVTRLDAAIS